jgi:hypothetical protein
LEQRRFSRKQVYADTSTNFLAYLIQNSTSSNAAPRIAPAQQDLAKNRHAVEIRRFRMRCLQRISKLLEVELVVPNFDGLGTSSSWAGQF